MRKPVPRTRQGTVVNQTRLRTTQATLQALARSRHEGLSVSPNAANMDMRYAVVLEPDEDAFQVIVPAFPEIHTFGDTVEDALAMARDAIELSIAVRRDEGTEVPPPDAGEARLETVAVNPHAA